MNAFSHRTLVGALAMGVFATTVFAGSQLSQEVTIKDTKGFAYGDLGYARNTADTVQYIGCSVTGVIAVCAARDSTGLTRSCSTSDPDLMALARSLNGDSYLSFSWDGSGFCTTLQVRNYSWLAPK